MRHRGTALRRSQLVRTLALSDERTRGPHDLISALPFAIATPNLASQLDFVFLVDQDAHPDILLFYSLPVWVSQPLLKCLARATCRDKDNRHENIRAA